MTRPETYSQEELRRICAKFVIYGDFLVAVPFGAGHVNDTFQLTYDQGGVRLQYVLQRINRNVVRRPELVMENMDRVTRHLLAKIHADQAQTRRRTIRLLQTHSGEPFVVDDAGSTWRAYVFVENARAYEVLETPAQAFKVAEAFGGFQRELCDLPGPRLHETIPDFHDTPKRIERLKKAAREDSHRRLRQVRREVDFVLKREEEAGKLLALQREGSIPERITHNDTKVNNILIDDLTGDGICVIDLDTVMPGLALYDFGDMVRAGTNPAAEDEVNLDKVGMRFDMYEGFYRGFVKRAGEFLTEAERENLPFSAKLMTFEVGVRFLTDYLEGDVYFKTRRPDHNLERCRNQLKMVSSMEEEMGAMRNLL